MGFSVFVKGQKPASDVAPHHATRTVAMLVLSVSLAERCGQNAIILNSEQSWPEVKRQARAGRREIVAPQYIPAKLPPIETGGCLQRDPGAISWALAHAGQTQYLRRKARILRLALGFDKPKIISVRVENLTSCNI